MVSVTDVCMVSLDFKRISLMAMMVIIEGVLTKV